MTDRSAESRHFVSAYTADKAAARYRCLIDLGFPVSAADHVFESINLPDENNIRGKLDDLKALGFENPVKHAYPVNTHPLGLDD